MWWNEVNAWFFSDSGAYVMTHAVVPALAILVAGLLAAWIASSAMRRVIHQRDRELKASAIGALVDAAEQAVVWHSLSAHEQLLADRASAQADIQVRLLPLRGSDVAANWATYALREMKKNSAAFGFQVEPAVIEFRDQLVEWQHHPSRMRKYFQADLERWADEARDSASPVENDVWNSAAQRSDFVPAPTFDVKPAPLMPQGDPAKASPNPVLTDTATQRVLNNVEAVQRGNRAVS